MVYPAPDSRTLNGKGMKNTIILAIVSLLFIGCSRTEEQPTRTETTVNVQSYLMDASAFDMEAVIAKLKQNSFADGRELQDFINQTPGINNVDLDRDGKIDDIIVTEEKSGDGSLVMAVTAHPSSGSGDPTVVAELGFQKNIQTGQVEVTGAYPSYVNGHHQHYYHHTLTGSVIGDMMFYNWMFSPRPIYRPAYRYGMYSPRSTLSRSQVSSTRRTYRSTNKVSPVMKASKPSTYKPSSTSARKTASKYSSGSKSGSTLSSKSGQASSFKQSTASSSKKATGFGAIPSKPKSTTTSKPKSSSWGSSSSSKRSSFGSSRSSFGSRKSSAQFKHDIKYLNEEQLRQYAEQFYSMSLATWKYNDELPEADGRTKLGIIVEDVDGVVLSSETEVDLYSYTSVVGAAVQVQQQELELLREEVLRLRHGICQ